ncbi:MAG: hypothetical protein J6T10_30620 [Methanobrevibacter sp.]|nr:hypothetical protein [Methanobrevibacter sp.]
MELCENVQQILFDNAYDNIIHGKNRRVCSWLYMFFNTYEYIIGFDDLVDYVCYSYSRIINIAHGDNFELIIKSIKVLYMIIASETISPYELDHIKELLELDLNEKKDSK